MFNIKITKCAFTYFPEKHKYKKSNNKQKHNFHLKRNGKVTKEITLKANC